MKIIYLTNARIPTEKAHGIQIMKMCEAFVEEGHTVTLVAPWRFNHIKENPFSYFNIKKNFKITKLPSLDFVWLGKFGFLVQIISFSFFASLYVLFKKVDIIYSREDVVLWPLSFIRRNLVWEIHMPRNNFFSQLLLKRLQKIITISQGLKDFYIKKEVPEENILVAHDGVDVEEFDVEVDKKEIQKKLGLPQDKKIVMYIGRLDPWKGVETLLKASKEFPENTQTAVIGEGSQLDYFKKKYKDVLFLGSLPYRDLPYNQKTADVLVIPNSGKSEISRLYTSPLKVFAHMASRVPIVVSDLPSMREVLSEETVYFAVADDYTSFANSVRWVLGHEKESKDKTAAAYKAVQSFTWNERVKHVTSFLK